MRILLVEPGKHPRITEIDGSLDQMQKAIELLDEVKESIINAYELKTGLSRTKLSHIMDAETWLNAHKAKEMGFCDEVLYEDDDDRNEDTGKKPEFIFSEKTAARVLMNKVLDSIPKPAPVTEHPPDDHSTADPIRDPTPDPIPDNRVKAADLEKRLSLLK